MSIAMMPAKTQDSNAPADHTRGNAASADRSNAPEGSYAKQMQALSPGSGGYAVQLAALSPAPPDGGRLGQSSIAEMAAQGTSGGGGALPHQAAIQQSFGRHDVSAIQAHTGGAANEASQAMGARGYAYGDSVAFAGAPDLHTSAHEAAHFFQQQAGVQLAGGVGKVGDEHENHADAVADAVVAGESAEGLLDQYVGTSSVKAGATSEASVQHKPTASVVSALDFREAEAGDTFVADWAGRIRQEARTLVKPWVEVRKSPDSELPGACKELSGFLGRQRSAMVKALAGKGKEADAAIAKVMAQAKTELVKGTFVQYLTEIRLLHRTGHDLCTWLDIEVDDDCHSYALEVDTIAGASASVGLGAGLAGKTYKVSYSNKVLPGLDWDHSFATVEGTATAGTPSAGVGGTAGGTSKYRAMKARDYHGPSWFTEDAGMTTVKLETALGVAGGAVSVGDSVVMFSDGTQGVSFVSAGSKLSERIQVKLPGLGAPKDVEGLTKMLTAKLGATVSMSVIELIVHEHDRPESWDIGDPSGELDVEADDVAGAELLLHQAIFLFEPGESELTAAHLKKVDLLVKRMNNKSYQPLDAEFSVNVTGLASARWDAIEKRVVSLEERYESGRLTPEQYREKRDELIDEKRAKNEALASLRAENAVWALSDRLELPDVKIDQSLIDAGMKDNEFGIGLDGRLGAGEFSSEAKDQRVEVDVKYKLKAQQG